MSDNEASGGPRRVRVERGLYRRTANGKFVYEIQWTEAGRVRWRSIPGMNLTEARAARGDILAKLGKGERVAMTPATVSEIAALWLASKTKLRPATIDWYSHAVKGYVEPALGHRKIGGVTTDDVARLVASMEAKGYASWTIRGTLTVLGGICGYAVRRGFAATNVVRQLEKDERPASTERESRILMADQIAPFIAATPPLYRVLIATAIFTGLRQSELLALKWTDVDFQAGTVSVRYQLDRKGNLVAPKTRESRREVILMPSLARILRAHRLASGYSGDDDFVFASATGGPSHYRNIVRRGFERAATAAEVNAADKRKLVFHDLRRTFGSLLIAQGCDVVFVSTQMGHSSVAVTLSVYAKLFDGRRHAADTSARLESAFGAAL